MNRTHAILTAAFAAAALAAHSETLPAAPETTGPAKVFLIDDQTGDELRGEHGIEAIAATDLEVLIEGVVTTQREVILFHELIDEDAADNEVRELRLLPYQGGASPQPPSATLPYRQLVEDAARYRVKRAEWIRGIRLYQNQLSQAVQNFVRDITGAQLTLTERFDMVLLSRNGRDFNRSDVAGTVLSAGKRLGTDGLRIAILNTDAEDRPSSGSRREKPFTPAELDPGILLVWVNTSGKPQQGAAFAGLPNAVHHVAKLAEAMEFVRQQLGGQSEISKEVKKTAATPADR